MTCTSAQSELAAKQKTNDTNVALLEGRICKNKQTNRKTDSEMGLGKQENSRGWPGPMCFCAKALTVMNGRWCAHVANNDRAKSWNTTSKQDVNEWCRLTRNKQGLNECSRKMKIGLTCMKGHVVK